MSMRSSFSRNEFLHSILGSGKNSGYINLELDGTTDFLSGLTCFPDIGSSEGCWTSDGGELLNDLDTRNTVKKIFINHTSSKTVQKLGILPGVNPHWNL